MKTKLSILPLLGAYLIALFLHSPHAATFRVDKAGGTGVFTNINDAVKAAAPNDTIRVGPGRYEESVTVTKNLTFVGDGPQYVLIAPSSNQGHGFNVNDRVSAVIRGFAITCKNGWGVSVGNQATPGGAASTIVMNCVIYGSEGGVHHSSLGSGMDGLGARISVEHCTIVGCRNYGVYFNNQNYSGFLLIRNCILSQNAQIHNDRNVYVGVNSRNVSFNHVYGKQSGDFPTLANVDPQFVDETGFNFVLQRGSPARDTAAFGEIDPDGSPADLGAYGGQESRSFWPYPTNGPVIKDLSVSRISVNQGERLTIKATATTR